MALDLTKEQIQKFSTLDLEDAVRLLLSGLPREFVREMAASTHESECEIVRGDVVVSDELQSELLYQLAPRLEESPYRNTLVNTYKVSSWRNEVINALYIGACGYAASGPSGMESYLKFAYRVD